MTQITASKRFPKRSPLFMRGVLESQAFDQEVRLRDLSVDGALLEGPQGLPVFEIVSLTCGSSNVNGIVAWSKGGRIGIEFSEPITGETLGDALRAKLTVSAHKTHCLSCY